MAMLEEDGLTVTVATDLGAVIASVKVLEALSAPDVPVTVRVYCPRTAVLVAVSVS